MQIRLTPFRDFCPLRLGGIAFFILALVAVPRAQAQDQVQDQAPQSPGISFVLESEEGPVELLIGEGVRRDAEAGLITMTGGVQLRREPDLLLIADALSLETTAGVPSQFSDVETLSLSGTVFIRADGTQVQAQTLAFFPQTQEFTASGGRVFLRSQGQWVEAGRSIHGNFLTRTFHARGGVRAEINETQIAADELTLVLPPPESSAPPDIQASGSVQFTGLDFTLTADRMDSTDEADILSFADLIYRGSLGTFRAANGWLNTRTQSFTLTRTQGTGTP